VDKDPLELRSNRVEAGQARGSSLPYAVYLKGGNTHAVQFENNLLASSGVAVWQDTGDVRYYNNTVASAGGSSQASADKTTFVFGRAGTTTIASLANNLIYGYGISEGTGTTFAQFQNNAIWRNSTTTRFVTDTGTQLASIADVETYLALGANGGGNIEADGSVNQVLSATGADRLLETLHDNNWRLADTADCALKQGGRVIAGVTLDYTGATRTATLTCGPTNAGAAGWSIGAYEY
jgi:hypothetical protein